MDENKEENNPKKGVSIQEIEVFTKKYRFEFFFCLSFILACFFSFVFFRPGWSILFATIGALIGILLHLKVEILERSIFQFLFKQEKTTQIILGIVWLILSIFLPPLIFLFLGLSGGKGIYHKALEIDSKGKGEL